MNERSMETDQYWLCVRLTFNIDSKLCSIMLLLNGAIVSPGAMWHRMSVQRDMTGFV
jgi:hypothetical protein